MGVRGKMGLDTVFCGDLIYCQETTPPSRLILWQHAAEPQQAGLPTTRSLTEPLHVLTVKPSARLASPQWAVEVSHDDEDPQGYI